MNRIFNWLIFIALSLFLSSPFAAADDLILTGSLNGTYDGDNVYNQGDCTVEIGSDVTLNVILQTTFGPGFSVDTGGKLTAVNIDNDGLPNAWELQYFGHLDYGPNDDPDGDQISNGDEYASGNNPVDSDMILTGIINGGYEHVGNIKTIDTCTVESMGDTTLRATFRTILTSGFSVDSGGQLTIVDVDNDGLSNHCELLYFGHLNHGPDDDIDFDKLTNFEECILGYDPSQFDLDNDDDGLEDWWEIKYFGLTLEHGANDDPDGDGVSNRIEKILGSNPAKDDLPGPSIHYEYDALGRIKKIWRIPAE